MDAETINIYSYEDFIHKKYIKKMEIKKFILIHLLLDDGRKSGQVLLSETSEFNPTFVNYSDVNIPSLRYKDKMCKYMDYFNFVEGFFCGKEYDDNIKLQRLYLTKNYLETYYFWKEIDFETYKNTLLRNKVEDQKVLEQLNKTYQEWLLGSKILLKHYDADIVNALDLEDFEKNINIINPGTNEKTIKKHYTGIIPTNHNF